jgi:hypothetical protein
MVIRLGNGFKWPGHRPDRLSGRDLQFIASGGMVAVERHYVPTSWKT